MLFRIVAILAILLGVKGISLTDSYLIEALFRLLFIIGGLLSFFKHRAGIILLTLALALSIPDIEIGNFYWTPVRLFRFPVGTQIGGTVENFRLGIDLLSILLLFLLRPALND